MSKLDHIDTFNDAAAKAKGLLIALLSNFKTDEFGGNSAGFGNNAVASLLQVSSENLEIMGECLFKICAVANENTDQIGGFDFENRVLRAQSIILSLLSDSNFETLKNNNIFSLLELATEQVEALTAGATRLSFD
jgi:hypothetical protein